MSARATVTENDQRRGRKVVQMAVPLDLYGALQEIARAERRSIPQQVFYLLENAPAIVEWLEAVPTDDAPPRRPTKASAPDR